MTTGHAPLPGSAPATAVEVALPEPTMRKPGWRAYLPGVAGVAYLAAWVAGLAAWPVNLAINAAASQVTASYAAHPAQAVSQYVLAQGLAGVLLGAVIAWTVFQHHAQIAARASGAAALGAIAVATSIVQFVIGLVLTAAATGHHVTRSGELSNLVNRLDGVKMLALAGVALWLAAISNPRPALPAWLRVAALPLALAIITSGYAYLTLSNALAWTAYISGPLLLLWVTGTGIWLTADRRRQAHACGPEAGWTLPPEAPAGMGW